MTMLDRISAKGKWRRPNVSCRLSTLANYVNSTFLSAAEVKRNIISGINSLCSQVTYVAEKDR